MTVSGSNSNLYFYIRSVGFTWFAQHRDRKCMSWGPTEVFCPKTQLSEPTFLWLKGPHSVVQAGFFGSWIGGLRCLSVWMPVKRRGGSRIGRSRSPAEMQAHWSLGQPRGELQGQDCPSEMAPRYSIAIPAASRVWPGASWHFPAVAAPKFKNRQMDSTS